MPNRLALAGAVFIAIAALLVDALVWAFSELLVEPMKSEGIFEVYRRNAEAAEQCDKPQPTQNHMGDRLHGMAS
jgi:hypothetical protein